MAEPKTGSAVALNTWTTAILESYDLATADAAIAAEALVDSSLYGFDTHGVALLPAYLERLTRGAVNARPSIRIEARAAVLEVDADRALGQVAVTRALDLAIDSAKRQGVAAVTIRNVGHLGALGWFTRRAALSGAIAILMQNGPPVMGPPGATRRAIGNNPFSFSAPLVGRPPIVFDAAMSEAAYGKILRASAAGERIPLGWALNTDGKPTRDPTEAADGVLLPLGGFKGVALAMLVETRAGSLSGMRPEWGGSAFGAFLLVFDPAMLSAGADFDATTARWLDHYLSSSPGARYPGQRAAATFAQRTHEGIPLDAKLRATLREIGESQGRPFPT